MAYLEIDDPRYGQFDAESLRKKGLELRDAYQNAAPFPHIAIDDFVPAPVLDLCLAEFPSKADPDSRSFDRDQERFKTSFNPDYLSPPLRAFFYSLNSRPFLQFLENLSGIRGLIPDPFYVGGGFHETRTGGHLSVHADFNHHKLMDLERRLNVLIYLNRDWRADYGGALELWDEKMERCVRSIEPEFGRCVVFSTTGKSYHGHPAPVAHPEGKPRRSIALYYYTATWGADSRARTTQFRARKGTEDQLDWRVRRDEILTEYLPPALSRPLLRTLRGRAKTADKPATPD